MQRSSSHSTTRPFGSLQSTARAFSIAGVALLAMTGSSRADTPDEQWKFATGLYSQKLWSLAAENLSKFVVANPRHAQAKLAAYQLGAALYRATDGADKVNWAKAAAAYERALANYPDAKLAPAARYELADAYFQSGKFERAATTYAAFLQSKPASAQAAEALYARGDAYNALKKPELARADYARVLASHAASRPAPYAALALALLDEDAGKSAAAATAYQKLIARYPNSDVVPEARLRRANVLLELNRAAEARTEFQRSLDDPNAAQWKGESLLGLADAQFAAKDWAGAASAYERAANELPADDKRRAVLQSRRGDSLFNAKDYAAALEVYAPLVNDADAKRAANALYFRGRTLMAQNQNAAAIAEFARLIERFPKSERAARAALLSGDAHAQNKDTARAAEAYRLVLTRFASDAAAAKEARAALVDLAGATATGDDKGGEALERVLRSLPSAAGATDAQLRLAQAAFDRADWPAAIRLSQTALAAKPAAKTRENALYLLASAQLNAGRAAEAATNFRQQLAASSSGAQSNAARLGLTWALLDAKQWTAAQTAARGALGALDKAPASPANSDLKERARLALGEALLRGGQNGAAATTFAVLQNSKDKEIAAQSAEGAALAWEAGKQWGKSAASWGRVAAGGADAPARARAFLRQGLALVKAKNSAAAMTALDAALKADPSGETGARALFESAWLARDSKNSAQEVARWQRLAADFPDSKLAATAQFQIGESLFAAKKWDEAASAYRVVTEKFGASEDAPSAWYQLGASLFQTKDWPAAAAAFERAATFAKSDLALESLFWAGQSWSEGGDLARARGDYEKFVAGASQPNAKLAAKDRVEWVATARLGVARAVATTDAVGAAKLLQAVLAASPPREVAAEAHFRLAQSLQTQLKWREAAAQSLKVVTLFPRSSWAPQAQWIAAQSTEKSGDKSAAIELYRAIANRQPADEWTPRAKEQLQSLGG